MSTSAPTATGTNPRFNTDGFPIYPRTPEGAHLRLDHHQNVLGELRELFGESPNPITGEAGKGVMAYLHRNEAELVRTREQARVLAEQRQLVAETAAKNDEKWRFRWTVLGTIVTICVGIVSTVNTLAVAHPAAAPTQQHAP